MTNPTVPDGPDTEPRADNTPRPIRYTIEVWGAPSHSTADSGAGTAAEVAAKLRAEADLLSPQRVDGPDTELAAIVADLDDLHTEAASVAMRSEGSVTAAAEEVRDDVASIRDRLRAVLARPAAGRDLTAQDVAAGVTAYLGLPQTAQQIADDLNGIARPARPAATSDDEAANNGPDEVGHDAVTDPRDALDMPMVCWDPTRRLIITHQGDGIRCVEDAPGHDTSRTVRLVPARPAPAAPSDSESGARRPHDATVSLDDLTPTRRERAAAAALHRHEMAEVARHRLHGIATVEHQDVDQPGNCLGCLAAASVVLDATEDARPAVARTDGQPPADAGARERVAAYLAAHDGRYEGHEGAGGPSTQTEVARLVTSSGTHRILVDDLRSLAAAPADDTAAPDAARPQLDNDDVDMLLVSATRYALGRMTYIVGWTADLIVAHAKHMNPGPRAAATEDIRRALHDGHTGMDQDTAQWRRALTALEDRS